MSICLFLAIVLLCAAAKWLGWQSIKTDTIIPYGSSTNLYGALISIIYKCAYYIAVAKCIYNKNFKLVAMLIVCCIIGNYLAKLLERKMYSKEVLSIVDLYIREYPNADYEYLLRITSLPLWWLKLMPHKWRMEYLSKVRACRKEMDE